MDSLIGAWALEDFSETCQGTVVRPFGERPSGVLLYAAEGWMSALLTADPDVAPVASHVQETVGRTVAYAAAGSARRTGRSCILFRRVTTHRGWGRPWCAMSGSVRDGWN